MRGGGGPRTSVTTFERPRKEVSTTTASVLLEERFRRHVDLMGSRLRSPMLPRRLRPLHAALRKVVPYGNPRASVVLSVLCGSVGSTAWAQNGARARVGNYDYYVKLR